MTAANTILASYQAFAGETAPYLHIKDDVHYEEALTLIETYWNRHSMISMILSMA